MACLLGEAGPQTEGSSPEPITCNQWPTSTKRPQLHMSGHTCRINTHMYQFRLSIFPHCQMHTKKPTSPLPSTMNIQASEARNLPWGSIWCLVGLERSDLLWPANEILYLCKLINLASLESHLAAQPQNPISSLSFLRCGPPGVTVRSISQVRPTRCNSEKYYSVANASSLLSLLCVT